jgi:hypothetical protein
MRARKFAVIACPTCHGIQPVRTSCKTRLCPYCGRTFRLDFTRYLVLRYCESAREARLYVSAIKAKKKHGILQLRGEVRL